MNMICIGTTRVIAVLALAISLYVAPSDAEAMFCEPMGNWPQPSFMCEGDPSLSTQYSYWSASGMFLFPTSNPHIPIRSVRCRDSWYFERTVSWHYRWLSGQGIMQEITDTGVFSGSACEIEA